MDAFVQLVRNALCCVKDLGLFRGTVLWDSAHTALYLGNIPPPLNKTTPLEVCISVTQFYAFASLSSAGLGLLLGSYGKIRRIQRLIEVRPMVQSNADRLINASLFKEAMYALRSMFIGINVFFIGCSFFWLFGNSWHVTETDWIGGLPGLINALTVMEICLVPLLYYMYRDGTELLSKADRMEQLAMKIKSTGRLAPQEVGLASLEVLSGWVPFWGSTQMPWKTIDSSFEEKTAASEITQVERELKNLVGESGAKETKLHLEEKADELLAQVRITRLEGYREYIYLVVNFVAFYGYLLGIVAYYWPDDLAQPSWIKFVLLHMTSRSADWHGNFAGDLMWTLEPTIILTTPILFRAMRPRSKKTKTD